MQFCLELYKNILNESSVIRTKWPVKEKFNLISRPRAAGQVALRLIGVKLFSEVFSMMENSNNTTYHKINLKKVEIIIINKTFILSHK